MLFWLIMMIVCGYLLIGVVYVGKCSTTKNYEDVSEWDIILWPIDIIVTIACLIIFSLVEICSYIKKTHYNKEEKEIKNES
jgi:hypothetical protein